MARITVFPNKYAAGWEGEVDESGAPVREGKPVDLAISGDLFDALGTEFQDDAHFVPYVLKGRKRCPRINKGIHVDTDTGKVAALNATLQFTTIVLDVDGPDHKASAGWVQRQIVLLESTPWADTAGWYATRGGYRLLWTLDKPVPPAKYLRLLLGLVHGLRKYGIQADVLKDWTRFYRLPYVHRDGEDQRHPADWSWMEDGHLDLTGLETVPEASGSVFAGIRSAKAPLNVGEEIPESQRNVTLTRLAGSLRRQGVGAAEIAEMLGTINRTRCNPPLPDSDLETIAKSVARYDPEPVQVATTPKSDGAGGAPLEPSGPRFTLGSEVEIAEAVSGDLERGEIPMVFDRGMLWSYREDRGLWVEVRGEILRRLVTSYDGEWINAGLDRNGNPKVVPLKVSQRLTADIEKLVYTLRHQHGWLNSQAEGIAFRDCFVRIDADGVHQEDFSPDHRQVSGLPFDFIPGARPAQFIQTLRECWEPEEDREARIELLREWIGAALCNRATLYDKGVILVGGGANGKSTIQTIVKGLFPANAVTAVNPQDMDNEYRRAMLATARLNIVAELPETDILNSEAVKAMISGDLVVARHIRQAPFEYHPKAAHLFSANSLPGVKDMTQGFWRRWIVLDFSREFAEGEQDRYLAGRIVSTELADLAAWALEGAARLAARGRFDVPGSVENAVSEWRRTADQVAMFVDMRLDRTLDNEPLPRSYWTPAGELYNFYVQWTVQAGHRQLSQVNFGKRLNILGIERSRTGKGVVWACRLSRPKLVVATTPTGAGKGALDV